MEKLKKNLLPVLVFAKIDIRRLFRDKVAIFFTIFFPLIFLFVFGGLFGGNDDVSFSVSVINRSDSEFASQFSQQLIDDPVFDVNEEITNVEDARERMKRSEISATIVLPEDFGALNDQNIPSGQAEVLYDQNNEQAGMTMASILESMFTEINAEFVTVERPFTVTATSTAEESLSQFDFTFSGLLGFAILSLGIFGPTNVFPRLKQRGVLRRYHTTTLKVWQYFLGNVLSNAFVGVLSVGVMFLVALTVFDLNVRGSYLDIILMTVLGTILLFGIGLSVGGWAKNENQAAPLANLLTFPMMFLSGVFFPTFLMPEWLQAITRFIPLTPVVDGLRLIVTEGVSILQLGSQVAIILGWTAIIYIIALRVFRWE